MRMRKGLRGVSACRHSSLLGPPSAAYRRPMRLLALGLFLALAPGTALAAEEQKPSPVLTGRGEIDHETPPPKELIVFRGSLLINEFVYRAVLDLPNDAQATP